MPKLMPQWIERLVEGSRRAARRVRGSLLSWLCPHPHAAWQEGKNYCPNCGRGFVLQWITRVCSHCGRRRPLQYARYGIALLQPYCQHCGTGESTLRVLEAPAYYQLQHALPAVFDAPDEAVGHLWTRVWVGSVSDKFCYFMPGACPC